MKTKLIGLFLCATGMMGAAHAADSETPLQEQRVPTRSSYLQQHDTEFNVVPYAQVSFLKSEEGRVATGGMGMAMQWQKDLMGLKLDLSTLLAERPILEMSAAPVFYPFPGQNGRGKGLYMGGGVGLMGAPTFGLEKMASYFPIFVGYHQKPIFFELNAKLDVSSDEGAYRVSAMPGAKIGFSF